MACKEYEEYMKKIIDKPKNISCINSKQVIVYYTGELQYKEILQEDFKNRILPLIMEKIK